MGVLTSVLDTIFLIYFALHIPTTILVDSQSVIPAEYFPPWAKELLQWHIDTNGDHLVSKNPVWFKSLVACELALQLPLFFVITYGFLRRRNWIRMPCILYGTHVATTMAPILADILFGLDSTSPKKLNLALIYLPYLVIPLLLVVRMLAATTPFPSAATIKRRNKRKGQ